METTNGSRDENARCAAIVDRWADFTKAFLIYPETNHRVRIQLDRLLDSVGELLETRSHVDVTLHRDVAVVADTRLDIEGSERCLWLKEQLDRMALAGLRFEAPVTAASMLAFTRCLTSPAATPTFESIHDESFDGLTLIDRRYDGLFESEAGGDRPELWSLDTAGGRSVLETLRGSAEVREKLEVVRDAMTTSGADADPSRCQVDLLRHIVDLLPADKVLDERETLALTTDILEALAVRTGSTGFSGDEQRQLEMLMLSVGRKYFAAAVDDTVWNRREQRASQTQAHSDDAITDSLPELLCEIELLPLNDEALILTRDAPDIADEHLAVFLFHVCHLDAGAAADRVHQEVDRRLDSANRAHVDCFRGFLDRAASRLEQGADESLDRLLDFAAKTGRVQLLKDSGFLDMARVERHFTRLLVPYLQTIEWDDPIEVRTLVELCERIGPSALLENAGLLARGGGVSPCAERLLEHAHPALMPLVHLVLRESGATHKRGAARFLRKVELRSDEACLLWIAPDPFALPADYLSALAAPRPDGSYGHETRERTARLLVRLVSETAGAPDHRIRAIERLGSFGSTRTKALLRELVQARRLLVLHREPTPVRLAARFALDAIEAAHV